MIAGDDSLDPVGTMVHISDRSYEKVEEDFDFTNATVVDYKQKRRLIRFACSNKAMITDIDSKTVRPAHVLNIHKQGLALSVKAEKNLSFSNIQIEIFDSKTLKSFVAKGEVKYIRGVAPFLIIGVEFKDISRLSVRRIEDFCLTAHEYI